MTERLDKKTIQRLTKLRASYDKYAVFNVALLLVGARLAYIPDTDDKAFCNKVCEMFPDRIDLISSRFGFRLLCRSGALSASDKAALEVRNQNMDRVLRRVLGYKGTAFPCSEHKALLIEWVFIDDSSGSTNIANHCAHPRELKACFDSFNVMRERAKALVGVKIGDFKVSRMAMMASPFDWA